MHLYPVSLLITVAVLLPNVFYLAFPPLNLKKYGAPKDSFIFTILERVGQVSCFVLPLFFKLTFGGTWPITAWCVTGVSLAFYYAGWIRYFAQGRDYSKLFQPMFGLPVPMAVFPVVYFFACSLVLGSIWQALAALLLGVGHITISAREYHRIEGTNS